MKSAYALLALLLFGLSSASIPYPSDDSEDSDPQLFLALEKSCDGNVVTVSDKDGNPIEGASLTVRDVYTADVIAFGETDDSGEYPFQLCGAKVDIKATKPFHMPKLLTATLLDCAQCEPECMSDADCPDNQQCVNGNCTDVQCACGIVQNHQCVEHECCADADCDAGEQCIANSCEPTTPPQQAGGCSNDTGCADTEYCNIPPNSSSGNCDEVEAGCGIVQNHTLVPYECGTGCPACAEGYMCVQNECLQRNLSCPSSGFVGDNKTCTATEGGAPCAECDYEIVSPAGVKSTGKTDAAGRIALPLGSAGNYTVALLGNGQIMKKITLEALPKASPTGSEKSFFASMLENPILWALIALIIVIAALVLWRRKG